MCLVHVRGVLAPSQVAACESQPTNSSSNPHEFGSRFALFLLAHVVVSAGNGFVCRDSPRPQAASCADAICRFARECAKLPLDLRARSGRTIIAHPTRKMCSVRLRTAMGPRALARLCRHGTLRQRRRHSCKMCRTGSRLHKLVSGSLAVAGQVRLEGPPALAFVPGRGDGSSTHDHKTALAREQARAVVGIAVPKGAKDDRKTALAQDSVTLGCPTAETTRSHAVRDSVRLAPGG